MAQKDQELEGDYSNTIGRRVIYSKKMDKVYGSKDGKTIKGSKSLFDILEGR